MVDQPLVEAADLGEFPGAPFSAAVVAAAAGQVRAEAGWHIAPQVAETVEIETGRSTVALLPSLRVVEVTAVRNAEDGTVLDGWRLSASSGVLTRKAGWPETIEVDLTHGYAKCPAELVSVVADRAQRGKAGLVRQESLGARSVSYAAAADPFHAQVLARYTLPPRP